MNDITIRHASAGSSRVKYLIAFLRARWGMLTSALCRYLLTADLLAADSAIPQKSSHRALGPSTSKTAKLVDVRSSEGFRTSPSPFPIASRVHEIAYIPCMTCGAPP